MSVFLKTPSEFGKLYCFQQWMRQGVATHTLSHSKELEAISATACLHLRINLFEDFFGFNSHIIFANGEVNQRLEPLLQYRSRHLLLVGRFKVLD